MLWLDYLKYNRSFTVRCLLLPYFKNKIKRLRSFLLIKFFGMHYSKFSLAQKEWHAIFSISITLFTGCPSYINLSVHLQNLKEYLRCCCTHRTLTFEHQRRIKPYHPLRCEKCYFLLGHSPFTSNHDRIDTDL